MKKLLLGLAAAAATVTAVAAIPATADAQPYHRGWHRGYHHHPVRVCFIRYHHRVCRWR